MSELFKSDIRRISDASRNDKLVIFVGAGASSNSGIPNWDSLIKSLSKELPEIITKRETDYLKISQLYKNYRGEKEYLEKVRKELKSGIATYNPIHEIIFKLQPSHIVTTNYDDLLEQVILDKNLQYYKISKDKDLPYASYNRFIIKMHGDIEIGNIVLTEDDYLNYSNRFPLTETYVKSLFASKLILFVGFSFEDYNLKIITNTVKYLLGDDFQPMYLLSLEKTEHLNQEYYKKRGVRIIDYNDCIEEELRGQFTKRELDALKRLTQPKGKDLYRYLLYINKFNPFKESHKDKDIIEILFELIKHYFNELPVIGADNFLKFYPFNEDHDAHYGYFVFETGIREIHDLRNTLRGNFHAKRNFILKNGSKYHMIKFFAKNNGIDSFHHKLDEKPNEYSNLSQYGISKKESGIDYLYKLDFINLFQHISKLKSSSNPDIGIIDLELPYLLYKTGQYYESYLKLKELAQKSWVNQKYILFFICQSNIKNVSRLIRNQSLTSSKRLDFDQIKEIEEEAKKIDLDDILVRIQTKSSVLHQILQRVNDYRFVYEIIHSINRMTEKIDESNKIARNGGFSSNSVVEELLVSTWLLWNFTNKNYIFSEHYNDHQFIYTKAFEGFIISNSIPESDGGFWGGTSKLKELYPFHIIIILFQTDYKQLKNLFDSRGIEQLIFSESSLSFIEKMFENGFASFSKIRELDRHNSELLSKALGNLILILSKIKTEANLAVKVLQNVIKTKTIGIHKIEKSLIQLTNKIDLFSSELLNQLFSECFLRESFPFPTTLTMNLANRINSFDSGFRIKERKILDFLKSKEFIQDYQKRYMVMYLYDFLPETAKKAIVRNINQELSKKFELEIFWMAYEFDLPLKMEFREIFVEKLESYFASRKGRTSSEENYTRMLGKIYLQDSDSDLKKRIIKISNGDPLLDFLVRTEHFTNYSEFDVTWLRNLSDEQYKLISKKKGIRIIIENELRKTPQPRWLLEKYFQIFGK
jgi:hypothetical protein